MVIDTETTGLPLKNGRKYYSPDQYDFYESSRIV